MELDMEAGAHSLHEYYSTTPILRTQLPGYNWKEFHTQYLYLTKKDLLAAQVSFLCCGFIGVDRLPDTL